MPEVICDTSPIQYLHQLELLHILPALSDRVIIPPAETLNLRLTGTLGLLIDAKRVGLISAIAPSLDQLQALRFRFAFHTRIAVLRLAGEEPS